MAVVRETAIAADMIRWLIFEHLQEDLEGRKLEIIRKAGLTALRYDVWRSGCQILFEMLGDRGSHHVGCYCDRNACRIYRNGNWVASFTCIPVLRAAAPAADLIRRSIFKHAKKVWRAQPSHP